MNRTGLMVPGRQGAWPVVLGVVVTALAAPSQGEVLLHTGFESAQFTPGLAVDGQGGWLGLFSPGTCMVTDDGARNGRHCVSIGGEDLGFAAPGVVASTFGTELLFDPVAADRPLVTVRADVRLDGPDTGEGPETDLLSANLFVVNTAGQVLAGFFVSSNGTIYAFGRGGQNYMFATPCQTGSYATLELGLDYQAGTVECRVNGAVIGELDMDPLGTLVTTEIWTAALEVAALDDPDVLDRSLYTAFFDNVFVSAAPGQGRP